MLKIWGRLSSINVQKVVWTVQELALPFTRTDVGGKFGQLDTPEYGRLNPNRKIPTIDDEGFILWESQAIMRYLAAKHGEGSLWPTDVQQRADADRWMDWVGNEVQPATLPAFWGLIRTAEDKRDMKAIEDSIDKSNALMLMLNDALAGRDFITGSTFTMGDIATGCAAHRWFGMPIADRPETPALSAWYRRIRMRPATQDVLTFPLT